MSFLTGTNTELIYASTSPGTAKNTFTTEVQINDTAGMGVQAHLPPDFWLPNKAQSVGKGIRIHARGLFSVVAATTPTFTFTVRLGAAGSITAATVLGTAALTTVSGTTNSIFELEGDVVLTAIGAAGTNSTVQGIGLLTSPGTANKVDPAWGGAASPGTVATLDTSITNYINFNVACSASAAGNTITLQQLLIFGLN